MSTLIPNVQANSLTVMDNASYHSRHSELFPIKNWTKKRTLEWLQAKRICFPPKAHKNEIFQIIQQQNSTANFAADEISAAAGKKFEIMPLMWQQ